MKNNKEIIKKWYKLAKPSKKHFIFQTVAGILARATFIVIPIPAANLIISLTNQDYKAACISAIFVFSLGLVRQLFWHIYYMSSYKSNAYSYLNIQETIFNKFLSIKEGELKKNSKEKILNTVNNDIYEVAVLSRRISKRIGIIIRIIITVIIVMYINIYVGLFLAFITVINYYILNSMNIKYSYWISKRKESKDVILNEFDNILERRDLINKTGIKEEVLKEYQKVNMKFAIHNKRGEWFWGSIIDNWFFAFTLFIILIATIFLIFLLSNGVVTLTLYLIVIPYIKEIMSETQSLFGLLTQIKNTGISVARVNTILDFDDEEVIKLGDNEKDDIEGEIYFNNVSYKNNNIDDISYGKINDISFSIKKGTINLIKGAKQSGKRQIFYLLNRHIKQEKGSILLDGISIFEYGSVYSSNVNYITYKPNFLNGSILKNMKLIEKNKEEIIRICKNVGIHKFITSLPKGYKTDINSNLNLIPNGKLFLLSLARILLTKSEVIMIYEFPVSLSDDEIKNIKNILLSLKEEKTILIFSALDTVKDISDKTIEIKRGKL